MSDVALRTLAHDLGVSLEALQALGVERNGTGWNIPERDADGVVIGTARRFDSGGKSCVKGSKRGLTFAPPLDAYAGSSPARPILIVEGMSDTAAGMTLGLVTIGRPSATGGLEHLAALLKDRHVCIVGENDNGAGKLGAEKIAAGLLGVAASVKLIYPPADAGKDMRQWLASGCTDAELLATIEQAKVWEPERRHVANLVRLADVNPEPIQWLWPGRIALGKLTMIAGDPGLGKSFVTLDMAARVSTGCGWPDDPNQRFAPCGVVLLSAEDDVADTIRPRLDAAGADVTKIAALQSVNVFDPGDEQTRQQSFCLATDLRALEEAIERTVDCRLVIIDPITAYMGGTDSHKNAEVRAALAPLSDMAARHDVAVVCVTHLNKSAGGPAIYRTMGSLAFAAAARAVWGVTKDKDDPSRRMVLPVKNNIAPDVSGLAYAIVTDDAGAGVVAWEPEPVMLTADEAMAVERGDCDRTEREEAKAWLREGLANGPVFSKDIIAEAKEIGIAEKTLRRANKEIGRKPIKTSFGGGWMWALKGAQNEDGVGGREDARPNTVAILGEGGHLGNIEPKTQGYEGCEGGQAAKMAPSESGHLRAQATKLEATAGLARLTGYYGDGR